MKSWRGQKSKKNGGREPLLPGLGTGSSPRLKTTTRRAASPGETALYVAQTRLSVIGIAFALFFIATTGRMALLTIGNEPVEPPVLEAATDDKPVTARADIQDRNGTVLATSLPTIMLMADARKVLDARDAAHKITAVLTDMDPDKLEKELRNAKRYVTVRRQLTPRQYYAINKLGVAGLEFVPDEARVYPAGNVTSHVLGYTDIDNVGISGLEKGLNERLQTTPEPVHTSLDIRLQTILHSELEGAVQEYKALGAAGLIMDVQTGEILSLVSLPDFDPINPGKASDDAKFNRATLGVYEMGSTFKVFNTAMALDSGLVQVGERFDTMNAIEVGGKRIRDYHPSKHWLNVAEILMESSNIGSARMADRVGTAKQKAFLGNLGLTRKLELEVPEIGAPIVPSAANWRETTTMTISFGHGLAVNAVQVAAAASAIVNGGYRVKPTLLKTDGKPHFSEDERLVSARTSELMLGLMRLVVKFGTGKKGEAPGYLVAGKTGTADKLAGRNYSENARMSSFLGVFPATAPRYLVLAILDDPKGTAKTYGFATGGWTSAPVVSHVIGQIGPLLNLPPVDQDSIMTSERQLLRPLGREVLESLGKETSDYASVESNSAR